MYRIWLLKLNKWILFVLFCLLLFALPVYAAYVKEPEVEVLTGGGESQNSAHYAVIGTISQSTPLCALSSGYIYSTSYRVYPGHIANLNSRIIARYGLQMQDTVADIDADENTQVAGVYFPLTLTAYDGYGYAARSDSGSQLDLAVNPSLLNFEADQLTLNQGVAGTNVYETAAGKYSLAVAATDVRDKGALLNLANLEIKPAWINNYTISASSPQKQGVIWSERVFSWDAYGNLVKDWDYLTTQFDPADFQSQESTEYSPLCSLEFYPALGLPSSGGTGDYSIDKTKGSAFVYAMANQVGNAQIALDAQAYDYVIGPADPGAPVAFQDVSKTIVIQPINWLIDAQFVYDYDAGELKASGWLQQDGHLVTAGLSQADLYIYDKAGALLNTLSGILDGQSIYQFSWSGADLADPTYFAKLIITHEAFPYTSNFSFNLDPTRAFTQTVTQELVVRIPQIEDALEETADEVDDYVSPVTTGIRDDVTRVLVASETTIPSHIASERDSLIGIIQTGVLNAPATMQQGKEYLVNFQTYSGVSPVIDIYDPDGTLLLEKQAMEEIEDSGVYRAQITFQEDWPRGNYTLVCSESTHGTMDASSVLVASSDIETIGEDMSAVLGTTPDIEDLKNLTADIEDAFYKLKMQVEEMLSKSAETVRDELLVELESPEVTEVKETSDKAYKDLLEIRRRLEDSGIVPIPIIEAIAFSGETQTTDLGRLRERFIQVEVVLHLHSQILDTYANEPVVETWYEFR